MERPQIRLTHRPARRFLDPSILVKSCIVTLVFRNKRGITSRSVPFPVLDAPEGIPALSEKEESVGECVSRKASSALLVAVLTFVAIGLYGAPRYRADPLRQRCRRRERPPRGSVPRATVTIVNKETNLTQRDDNEYGGRATTSMNVLPGPYDVKVTLQGFRESVRKNVPGDDRPDRRVDVALEVGTLTEPLPSRRRRSCCRPTRPTCTRK